MDNAADAILASSAISLGLLDKLIRKSVITRADGAAIMDTAAQRCEALPPVAAGMIRAFKTEMLRNQ
jgi:hypothetical protein